MQKAVEPDPPAPLPQTARERSLVIKQAQENALTKLPLNTLYIALYIRSDPPRPDDFHWAYYFHTNAYGGMKYHIKTMGEGWISDHSTRGGGLFKSNFLCVLVQIASVAQARHGRLDEIMKVHDGDVNFIPGVTCRVWLMTILQELIRDGIVGCNDYEALQRECMDFGNHYMDEAACNVQPRPVVRSTLCL